MAVKNITFVFSVSTCSQCPYKSDDGCRPGSIIVCTHPQIEKTSGDRLGRGVITYPECDDGFPPKCPLLLSLPNNNFIKIIRKVK